MRFNYGRRTDIRLGHVFCKGIKILIEVWTDKHGTWIRRRPNPQMRPGKNKGPNADGEHMQDIEKMLTADTLALVAKGYTLPVERGLYDKPTQD